MIYRNRSPFQLIKHGVKAKAPVTAVRALSLTLLVLSVKACSGGSAGFSEVKVSEQSQSYFNAYERVKDNEDFKKTYKDVLDSKPTYKVMDRKELEVNGQVFNDPSRALIANSKVFKKGTKGTYAQFLAMHGRNLGQVSARDFQLSEDILAESLKANGNQLALNNMLKKYSPDDFVRAMRAGLVYNVFIKIASDQDKASLNLAGVSDAAPIVQAAAPVLQESIKQRGETTREIVSNTIPKLLEAVASKKYKESAADVMNACSSIIATCVASMGIADNKKGNENYQTCEYAESAKPADACDNGFVRNNSTAPASGTFSARSNITVPGKDQCSDHSFYCECGQAYQPKLGQSDPKVYQQVDRDKSYCGWKYDHGSAPPDPKMFKMDAAQKFCENTKLCPMTLTLSAGT